jgi:hypothetical protein
LDTTVAFDHVTPFAGRPVPESRNDDTFKVTVPNPRDVPGVRWAMQS